MPELPEYYRQQRIAAGGAAQVGYAPDRSGEELGSVITQFGFDALEQFLEAQKTDQINTFQAETAAAISKYQQGLDPTGDPKDWESGFNEVLEKRKAAISEMSNGAAQTQAEDWYQAQSPGWRNKMFWAAKDAETDRMGDNLELQIAVGSKAAVEAPSDEEFEDNMAGLEKVIKDAGATMLLSPEEAELRWIEEEKRVRTERERFLTEVEQQAKQQTTDTLVDTAKALPELDGFALISATDDLTSAQRNEAKARLTEHHRIRKERNQAEMNKHLAPGATIESLTEARKQISTLDMSEGERTAADAQLLSRIREIDAGKYVFTPQRVIDELHTQALLIANASQEEKEQFKADVNIMAADVDKDGKKKTRILSTEVRDSVIETLNDTYKGYEAVQESDAITAGRTIVRDTESQLARLITMADALEQLGKKAEAKEQRQAILDLEKRTELETFYYNLYIADVRALKREKDLDPKAFAIQAQVYDNHYRGLARKSIAEMEAGRAAILTKMLRPEVAAAEELARQERVRQIIEEEKALLAARTQQGPPEGGVPSERDPSLILGGDGKEIGKQMPDGSLVLIGKTKTNQEGITYRYLGDNKWEQVE